MANKPEDIARERIDKRLTEAGWVVQNMDELNPAVSLGVAVREFPTSTGPVDYALFVGGKPVGVVEAKKDEAGSNITTVERQSARYANSKFKYIKYEYRIRFAYEATGVLTRFTDYDDIDYRSRDVFSFHQPQTLAALLREGNTIRNNLKGKYPFDSTGFRACQIEAIQNLDESFARNNSHALVHMATGAGKTFTAITSAYRLLKFGKMKRILFLVDTKSLGQQAEREFQAYRPNDDYRSFSQLYAVHRLTRSAIPKDVQVCISTIQRMYSILRGEELDESAEEMGLDSYNKLGAKQRREVVYNSQYPPEFFDCIIVDECHRSIYDVWSQVLEYFDSFIIGLTATPDKRTFAYFKNNVVSEYSREQAIIDGVNVGEDVFVIETEVTKNGGYIMRQEIERRNRLTREKRWEVLEDDVEYDSKGLDRDVVNPSQIRTIIRTFRDCWQSALFPDRGDELPKTLVFAKTDSHADDIIQIIREEFGKGNEFCQKITYSATNPEQVLSDFRSSYYPRVAVTVDMISAGTDVKPIECLLFMRDVRSSGYFEQMKGRGTRTISKDDLQKVSPSAKESKDHFVIVDAVGVMKSKKTQTRTLERKPSVSLKELMQGVALGNRDEDTLTSLANRLIRLNAKLSPAERQEFVEKVGAAANEVAADLLNSFDEDMIYVSACKQFDTKYPTEQELEEAGSALRDAACSPFSRPEVRDYIENVRRSHDQVIDSVNIDSLTYAGFDVDLEKHAKQDIQRFEEFIEEHKDEILALQLIYDAGYVQRPLAISQLKDLAEKLSLKNLGVSRLWRCYSLTRPNAVKPRSAEGQIADLVSLVRFACGAADSLQPFSDVVNYNFMRWTLAKNAGPVHFTDEQMGWLRLIRDHIASSLSVEADDLDLYPFDKMGGLGRFYELFGDSYEALLSEMNTALVV